MKLEPLHTTSFYSSLLFSLNLSVWLKLLLLAGINTIFKFCFCIGFSNPLSGKILNTSLRLTFSPSFLSSLLSFDYISGLYSHSVGTTFLFSIRIYTIFTNPTEIVPKSISFVLNSMSGIVWLTLKLIRMLVPPEIATGTLNVFKPKSSSFLFSSFLET